MTPRTVELSWYQDRCSVGMAQYSTRTVNASRVCKHAQATQHGICNQSVVRVMVQIYFTHSVVYELMTAHPATYRAYSINELKGTRALDGCTHMQRAWSSFGAGPMPTP